MDCIGLKATKAQSFFGAFVDHPAPHNFSVSYIVQFVPRESTQCSGSFTHPGKYGVHFTLEAPHETNYERNARHEMGAKRAHKEHSLVKMGKSQHQPTVWKKREIGSCVRCWDETA